MKIKNARFLGTFMGIVFPILFCGAALAQVHSWGFIPNSGQRFQVFSGNFGGAVLDRETGLIWTKQPLSHIGQANLVVWAQAVDSCYQQSINGRLGWRLPKVEELLNLKDTAIFGPDNTNLPLGHPFLNVLSDTVQFYWSSTTVASDPNSAYAVSMSYNQNTPVAFSKDNPNQPRAVWCVRSGTN